MQLGIGDAIVITLNNKEYLGIIDNIFDNVDYRMRYKVVINDLNMILFYSEDKIMRLAKNKKSQWLNE